MYIHESRGHPIIKPCVLFLHTRYTEVHVYMDRLYSYTPSCACMCRPTQLQKTSHFATPLTTALAVLFLKIFKLCFTNTCIFRLVHVATVIGILGFFNVKFVIFEGKYSSKAFV